MIFVFFPINVYLLNKNKKVVEKKEDLMPFRFYYFFKKAEFVIESKEKLRLKIGQAVTFI